MTEMLNGSGRSLARPVHAACVVARCWCRGSDASTDRTGSTRRGRVAAANYTLDLTAWRSVGLPVA